MPEPKNQAAIRKWVAEHRPDCTEHVGRIMDMNSPQGDAFILLMHFAFEAGRQFQSNTPTPFSYDWHRDSTDY